MPLARERIVSVASALIAGLALSVQGGIDDLDSDPSNERISGLFLYRNNDVPPHLVLEVEEGGLGLTNQVSIDLTTIPDVTPGSIRSDLIADGSVTAADLSTDYVKVSGDTMTGNLVVQTRIGVNQSAPNYPMDIVSATTGLRLGSNNEDSGMYMLSLAPDSFHLSAGASYNGANWIAKATDSVILSVSSGSGFQFWLNSGLTPNTSFAPALHMTIAPTGMSESAPGFHRPICISSKARARRSEREA